MATESEHLGKLCISSKAFETIRVIFEREGLFCSTHSVTPSQSRRGMALSCLVSSMPAWFLHCECESSICQRSDCVQCRQPSCQGGNSSADFISVPHCCKRQHAYHLLRLAYLLPSHCHCSVITFLSFDSVCRKLLWLLFIYLQSSCSFSVCVCLPSDCIPLLCDDIGKWLHNQKIHCCSRCSCQWTIKSAVTFKLKTPQWRG